jgi:LysM repeat protein
MLKKRKQDEEVYISLEPINTAYEDDSDEEITTTVPPDGTRKCVKCRKYYSNVEEDCLFHPGKFRVTASKGFVYIPGGSDGKWNCCKKAGEDAEGCMQEKHDEDRKTTITLNKFSNHLESDEDHNQEKVNKKKKVVLKDGDNEDLIEPFNVTANISDFIEVITDTPVDVDKIKKALGVEEGDGEFIRHKVSGTDNIQGIALKYGISVAKIKSVNRISKDTELYGHTHILVPRSKNASRKPKVGGDEKGYLKIQVIQKFKKEHSVSQEIAKYYLEANEFDYELACKDFEDDAKFDKNKTTKTKTTKTKKEK